DLAAFERSPEALYWRVESAERGAARLTDVEDLYALRGAALRALKAPPKGPYGDLDGRRYPGRLVRAAFALRSLGERERLREALGSYDVIGAAALKDALVRWRRARPAPGRGP
ncbi:MAG: hypothetical protein KGM24_01155, partial [Elusimicrobia bacterium]|nr:hypothetical protein [Elusimicrobiota bacterium]